MTLLWQKKTNNKNELILCGWKGYISIDFNCNIVKVLDIKKRKNSTNTSFLVQRLYRYYFACRFWQQWQYSGWSLKTGIIRGRITTSFKPRSRWKSGKVPQENRYIQSDFRPWWRCHGSGSSVWWPVHWLIESSKSWLSGNTNVF